MGSSPKLVLLYQALLSVQTEERQSLIIHFYVWTLHNVENIQIYGSDCPNDRCVVRKFAFTTNSLENFHMK